ncbi:hypothetical protein [Nocardiopsis kunsanensis]|uniref:Uncharacterized protein n=1 Tax=Nocardiopsis kunsanensis TaxID=141693 RepID=A0A919CLN8_9ACTN|nr:hypothetical protein [Nocardiopsis kunsanensis]GHD37419.1 hypothetical protein GCM10007147_45440 [Nocardiopsis kunsanensis]
MAITPIETRYAGHRFRSRLEARWAVFFDHLGIPWEYEPQGYLVDGKPYLPDFYLPTSGLWVEVKGSEDQLDIELLVDAVIPHWGLPATPSGRAVEDPSRVGARLLILGPVGTAGPVVERDSGQHAGYAWPSHAVLSFWKGDVTQGSTDFEEDGSLSAPSGQGLVGNDCPEIFWETRKVEWGNWTGGGTCLSEEPSPRVIGAYRAARSARFEHGEKG